jgi:hypothetical protein
LTREEIIRIQGIARLGYDFERPIIPVPREQPAPIMASTAIAPPPSPSVLRREMVKRAEAVERELAMHTEVSLAVAESRLPARQ